MKSVLHLACAAVFLLACASVHAQNAEQDQIDFANGLFQREYYDMAADAYKEYLETFPEGANVAAALERLGESEYSLKRFDAALSRFDKLVEITQDQAVKQRALLRKGEILYRLGKKDGAVAVLNGLTGGGINPDIRAGALYYLAMTLRESAPEEALKHLKTLAEELPKSTIAPYGRYQLAFVYLDLNRLEEAASEFTAVADSGADERTRLDSRFRAAEAYDKLGWYEQAVAAYKKLQAEAPDSGYVGRAALGYTWALYHAGDYENAVKEADAYLKATPEGDAAIGMKYLRANCLQQQAKYDAALKAYAAIRKQHPDSEFSGRALYKTAWTLFLQGKNEDAKKTIRAFLDEYKDSPLVGEAAFLRGSILAKEEDFEEAHQEFRYVAERYPDSEFGAEALYKVGECLGQLNRMEDAAQVFKTFVKKYPHHALAKEALIRIGDAKFSSAMFQEAIEEYKQTLEKNPDPVIEEETLYRLACAYHNLRQFKESAEIFQQYLAKYPKGSHILEANLRVGDYFLYDAKEPVKSIEWHQAVLDADPQGQYAGVAVKGLALARYETKDYDQAADLFLRLMTEYPDVELNEQTFVFTASRFFEQENWGAAATAYRALLSGVPDYPTPERVWLRIAECSEKSGGLEDAIKFYGNVVEAAPRSATAIDARYRMGQIYEKLKMPDKAIASYEEAARTNTGEAAAKSRFRLGELFEEKGDYAAANKHFMLVAILLLDENLSPEALWRAGQCTEKSGGDPRKIYQDVVSEYPDSEQAKLAQARLAELDK